MLSSGLRCTGKRGRLADCDLCRTSGNSRRSGPGFGRKSSGLPAKGVGMPSARKLRLPAPIPGAPPGKARGADQPAVEQQHRSRFGNADRRLVGGPDPVEEGDAAVAAQAAIGDAEADRQDVVDGEGVQRIAPGPGLVPHRPRIPARDGPGGRPPASLTVVRVGAERLHRGAVLQDGDAEVGLIDVGMVGVRRLDQQRSPVDVDGVGQVGRADRRGLLQGGRVVAAADVPEPGHAGPVVRIDVERQSRLVGRIGIDPGGKGRSGPARGPAREDPVLELAVLDQRCGSRYGQAKHEQGDQGFFHAMVPLGRDFQGTRSRVMLRCHAMNGH
jgi:hypothetical protein